MASNATTLLLERKRLIGRSGSRKEPALTRAAMSLDTWGWKTGAEVASDSFKLEIPAGAKKLAPDEVPELNDIPANFTPKGAK